MEAWVGEQQGGDRRPQQMRPYGPTTNWGGALQVTQVALREEGRSIGAPRRYLGAQGPTHKTERRLRHRLRHAHLFRVAFNHRCRVHLVM